MNSELITKLSNERNELSEKIDKLGRFIKIDAVYTELSRQHQMLLEQQYYTLQFYRNILIQRIELLKGGE